MKRKLVTIFACALVLLNLVIAGVAQAEPTWLKAGNTPAARPLLIADASPSMPASQTTDDMIEKLKNEFLPQLESILTPEQREKFQSAIVDEKMSLRKAFKEITLTPEQKTKLAMTLKSLPKKDIFKSLTPEQKKEFFMRKRDFFAPTADEIAELKAEGK